jgi:hypothetical protein
MFVGSVNDDVGIKHGSDLEEEELFFSCHTVSY